MVKYFTLIFSLFAINTLIAQEVTVTQKIPATAVPGGDYIAEATINKGEIKGFMKFFQGIPAGCTATAIESKGGSFSFADGGAKIIWITIPADNQFTISYRVTIPKDASGIKNINGKVSYLINDERKIYELETKTIQIGSETTNETVLVTGSDRTIITSSPVSTSDSKVITSTTPSAVDPPVKKEEQKPPTETIIPEPIPVVPPPNVAPVANVLPKKEEAVANIPPPATIKKEEKKTASATPPINTKVPVTAIPSSAGKTYRVQIGAFTLKHQIKGVTEPSVVVLDNGVTKYFSGNFPTYEEAAKRKKEMIEKGFQGAFIVSFENGKIVK